MPNKFSIIEFVDQLQTLVERNALYFQEVEKNQELAARVEELEADIKTLLNQKAVEYCREVETEVLVKLCNKLIPLFGFTKPENYERTVREFLSKR